MNAISLTKSPLERLSAGEITRKELGELLGQPISFGDMLLMLHEHDLPLPRYGNPYNPEAVELVKQWAEKAARD